MRDRGNEGTRDQGNKRPREQGTGGEGGGGGPRLGLLRKFVSDAAHTVSDP